MKLCGFIIAMLTELSWLSGELPWLYVPEPFATCMCSRFIDTDGSGDLSKDELRDGFFAMGVYLDEKVVDQIMSIFDMDGNGTVNYYEFTSKMFPVASRK